MEVDITTDDVISKLEAGYAVDVNDAYQSTSKLSLKKYSILYDRIFKLAISGNTNSIKVLCHFQKSKRIKSNILWYKLAFDLGDSSVCYELAKEFSTISSVDSQKYYEFGAASGNVNCILQLAKNEFNKKKYNKASELYNKILPNGEAYYYLGKIYEILEDYDNALKNFLSCCNSKDDNELAENIDYISFYEKNKKKSNDPFDEIAWFTDIQKQLPDSLRIKQHIKQHIEKINKDAAEKIYQKELQQKNQEISRLNELLYQSNINCSNDDVSKKRKIK